MDETCIESQGFCVGRWLFPPFTLRPGECVTLQLPQDAWLDQDRIISTLTGTEPAHGLILRGAVVFVEPAADVSGWRRWFHDPTPFDWLKKNTTLTEDAIQSILVECEIERPVPMSRHAGTPRLILGLHAAFAKKPAAIVFATTGLDPRGVRLVQQIVSRHLVECPALYLAWPWVSQGQEHRAAFSGSFSVSVIDNTEVPADRPNVTTSY